MEEQPDESREISIGLMIGIGVGLLVLLGALLVYGDDDPANPDPVPEPLRAVINNHCIRCHSQEHKDGPEGELDLVELLEVGAVNALEEWRDVRNALATAEMPPEGEAGPAIDERKRATEALDRWLESNLAILPPEPGRVSPRRLTRIEYQNSIRDLTGVEFDALSRLPADDVGNGFDNQGDVLTLPPMLLEKYFRAAEEIADSAIVSKEETGIPSRLIPGDELVIDGEGRSSAAGAYFWSRGSAGTRHFSPAAGTYRLKVKSWGQQAGPEPVKFAILVDGTRRDVLVVEATSEEPAVYHVDLEVESGNHRFDLEFINDYYKPEHPDPSQRDRNAAIASIEIEGPLEGLQQTPFQKQLLPKGGKNRLRSAVESLLLKVWRRPPGAGDINRMVRLCRNAAGPKAPIEERLRVALTAALVSPRFLIRLEADPKEITSGEVRDLDGFERATRLSYFLWSTTPDDKLLAAAGMGELDSITGLQKAARRLLADERSIALAENFASQWLRIRHLQELRPDAKLHGRINASLLRQLQRETITLFDDVLRKKRPIEELISGRYTFLNERLARFYGISGVEGNQFRRVDVETPRGGGLLSQGSILMATSTPLRTSPVLRGKWLLEVLLDDPPPPPPPGAGTLPAPGEPGSELPLRQQLAEHRRDPNCSVCHRRMDALGFALESFDAVGRWRTGEIDDSGELPDGTVVDGVTDLRAIVATSGGFRRSLAKKMLIYALGRGLDDSDAPALAQLLASLQESSTLEDLIVEVVALDAFHRRRIP